MLTSNPQRLAWITVVGALVVFCLLCLSAYGLGRWIIFESPVHLSAVLHVGKGTVGLAEPGSDEKVVRATDTVARHDIMRTDSLSQGYLAFSDPYSGAVVATVMMRSDTEMTLSNARRPRFSLSANPYVIQLTGVNGHVEVWVTEGLEREIRLEIKSPLGTLHITEPGVFMIDSTPESMTAMSRVGTATLINSAGAAQHLAVSTEGWIVPGEDEVRTAAGTVDLLPNWNFDQDDDWPVEWRCTNEYSPDNQEGPPGKFEFVSRDGRDVIHIERMQPDPGPHTTRCVQFPGGPGGLDVSQYDTLRLRVTMQVHHQSLSACGVAGTECPIMLYIRYVDQNGNPAREWFHGFYVQYTPNLGRKICDACWSEHEFINKDAWYTYESGNLFTDWQEDARPSIITEIHFYADGHQYDVLLSEVALIATTPAAETNVLTSVP